jgi:hypothetical protein
VTKVKLFYANGTSWAINILDIGFRVDQSNGQIYWNNSQQPEVKSSATILGTGGRTAQWNGGPQNDPFPTLVDPDRFEAVRIEYPASMFPMNASMDHGIAQVISGINAMPQGQPFVLGGYSQGAALMSTVYNEIRYGVLTSRASSFLGAVMFGNPRRQLNHRGAVGGTWSGIWSEPGATTGGAGSFPATGNYARLTSCESEWVEFAYPGDIFTANSTSTATGTNWTAGCDVFTGLGTGALITYFLSGMTQAILDAATAAFTKAGEILEMNDGAGVPFVIGGSGHTAYPFLPPQGLSGDTAYQVALTYLESLADQYATAPILAPPSKAGWSTTLVPPSA